MSAPMQAVTAASGAETAVGGIVNAEVGQVTTFKKMQGTHPAKYHKAMDVLRLIGTDPGLEQRITALRAEVDPTKRKELKDALPLVVWAGQFSKRGNANLTAHAGLLVLDFDKLPPDALATLRAQVVADPHTFGAFTSPSGNGLKVVVRIEPRPTSNEEHAHAWQVVADHYGNDPDASGKNVERVCFLSFDPDVYVNEGAEPLEVPTMPQRKQPAPVGIPDAELDAITKRALARVLAEQDHGEDERPQVPAFPIEVLPDALGWMAKQYKETLGWHPDYTGASMLYALSVALGEVRHVEAKQGWKEKAVLWLALVGRPGTGKTHPLQAMALPLKLRDGDHYRAFKEAEQFHETALEEYAIAVKAARGKKGKPEGGGERPTKPPEPVCRQHLVNDATPEALLEIMASNPRGVGLYRDELAGWIGDFGRYSKSGEQQFFLSLWSGIVPRIDRKQKRGGTIPKTAFLSVAGTIQPGVLNTLAADGRSVNGFMDRLLFAYPVQQEVPGWVEQDLPDNIPHRWGEIVGRLLALEGEPVAIPLSHEARAVWRDFHGKTKRRIDTLNEEGDEGRAGIMAKQMSYALRFALIVEMATWAEGNEVDPPGTVGADAMRAAVALSNYFTAMAFRVQYDLHEATPLDGLAGDRLRLYQALPDEFTTADAIMAGMAKGIARRSVERYLKDRRSYGQSKERGKYHKKS